MNPVYLFDNKIEGNIGINASNLREELISVCQSHKELDRARIFAFILTDIQSDQARELVQNDSFWNELNGISRNYLTVFHLDYESEELKRLFMSGKSNEAFMFFDDLFQALNSIFGTDVFTKIEKPSILFFQTHDLDIVDYFCLELADKPLAQKISDIRDYIVRAVNSVEGVHKPNLGNSKEIYDLLKSSIEGSREMKTWSSRLRKVLRIHELVEDLSK